MLRNRLPDVEIPKEAPFQFDKLNRRPCANTFCSLVKMYSMCQGTGTCHNQKKMYMKEIYDVRTKE